MFLLTSIDFLGVRHPPWLNSRTAASGFVVNIEEQEGQDNSGGDGGAFALKEKDELEGKLEEELHDEDEEESDEEEGSKVKQGMGLHYVEGVVF